MTYFKQYGEHRTGTNYLKKLLDDNFEDITVFGSLLGWKHGMYELCSGKPESAENHVDWIEKKERDGIIYCVDNYPALYSKDFLMNSVLDLWYIVSYKPMVPWLLSYKKFRYYNTKWDKLPLDSLCKSYFEKYNRWAHLPEATFIHHDSIVNDDKIVALLEAFEYKFGLKRKRDAFLIERKIIVPSTDLGPVFKQIEFDRKFYENSEYEKEIPEFVKDLAKNYDMKFIEDRCIL